MQVLILAGGYGTRLYPLVTDTPKSLLDVAGKPLLAHILDKVREISDLSGVLIVTNTKFAKHFEEWAEAQGDYPTSIRVVDDGTSTPEERLGSIGDIQFVLEKCAVDGDMLVIGGDNLFDYSLSEYVQFSRQHTQDVTVGLYDIHSLEDATRFGVVETDQDKKIISFEEKPDSPRSTLIAMCSYYFPKGCLGYVKTYLEETGRSDKAGEYIRWLSQKGMVYGFEFQGIWYDIGSIESLEEARKCFEERGEPKSDSV